MELKKDGVRAQRKEEESLVFLQKMASSQKMDIIVAVRNATLA